MKRSVTILLLFLFLLNTLGFYGLFVGLQFKNAEEANALLDEEQYSGADAMTFRIPVSIPYSTDQQTYQRVSGEFEHDGEVYRLVKQKMLRDTLYIVCVKDNNSRKINQALADYVKTFTDKPSNAKQQGGKLVLSFMKDYVSTGINIESQSSGWKTSIGFNTFDSHYLPSFSTRIEYPPKQVLSI